MKRRQIMVIAASLSGLIYMGCGRDTERKEAAPDVAVPNVTFKAGRGLEVSSATLSSLQVKTAPAEEKEFVSEMMFHAQVFDAGPPARATTLVATEEAELITAGQLVDATLQRTLRTMEATLHQVELIFALPGRDAKIGDVIEIKVRRPANKALAVPQAAVIDGATGPFVYVMNSDAYLRTPVKIGTHDTAWVEIADGLYAGDVVVVHGARKLWFAEMLLTKGGGDVD